jgi:PhnB protein
MGPGHTSPTSVGGSPVSLYVYLPDVDSVVKTAVAEGAKILKPVQDQFYGDRSGFIQDPFGHLWGIATHVEDVSAEDMKDRMKKLMPVA